jgi:serine O-acetyltransferase
VTRSDSGSGDSQVAGRLGWFASYAADIARYRAYRPGASAISLMVLNQGLWALLQYRIANSVYTSRCSGLVKRPLLIIFVLWQKLVEVLCGIELPYRALIAPGLYIGHFGNIIIHPDAVIGAGCNLSQGVTLGISGRGVRRGTPILGDRVYVGANAIIAGRIKVGNDSVIAGNALVTRDVEASAVMVGNPATMVSLDGSSSYISPDSPEVSLTAARPGGAIEGAVELAEDLASGPAPV